MPRVLLALALSLALGGSGGETGQAAAKSRLAPREGRVASTHGPFASGDCGACHVKGEGGRPGPARKPAKDVCLECHRELASLLEARKMRHPAPGDECTRCHNPHNSSRKNLLH